MDSKAQENNVRAIVEIEPHFFDSIMENFAKRMESSVTSTDTLKFIASNNIIYFNNSRKPAIQV